ncbi:murein L,D-transpeptidase catalytic domain family protein [Cyclobacterium plantarum]|uniref:Murein L,D-transpeptidase catalytic domain family protein n=1 Tax=Cyclobacterium plantarum TaxID=2716263 RepID=A0ABX0H5R1_9BACT|nr:murein L,D-transpeptidase catalytic domain family protein [Cyclobacterium plantarum]NHE57186.1 murein L,D-transpeptidase catalytic domain family protein [Cyclobacterium plantarum]
MVNRLIIILLFLASPVLSFGDGRLSIHEHRNIRTMAANHSDKLSVLTDLIWRNIQQESVLLRKEVLELALRGYQRMQEQGLIKEGKPLTVIDFDLPSTQKRLWVIDMKSQTLQHTSLVSHGRNSGLVKAEKFSNTPESHMSSLGFYLTGETYIGKHGASLRLDGLERGINDQARSRAIVIHAADYAEPSFLKNYGRLGRSLGCPALPTEHYEEIIALIKEKSCLFIHADQRSYKEKSVFVNQG